MAFDSSKSSCCCRGTAAQGRLSQQRERTHSTRAWAAPTAPASPKAPSPKANGSSLAEKMSISLPHAPAGAVLSVPGKPSSPRAAVQGRAAGERCSKTHCTPFSKADGNSSAPARESIGLPLSEAASDRRLVGSSRNRG